MESVDRLLTAKELADYLAVPLATVYRWRYHGVGQRGSRVGRHVRFRWVDVERWVEAQLAAAGGASAIVPGRVRVP
jgi:excisionase family DNA binding protein